MKPSGHKRKSGGISRSTGKTSKRKKKAQKMPRTRMHRKKKDKAIVLVPHLSSTEIIASHALGRLDYLLERSILLKERAERFVLGTRELLSTD